MQKEIAIERYERYVMGNGPLTLNGSVKEKETAAKDIIRYAILEMLGWTPQEAAGHMTWELVVQMKLDRLLTYFKYPKDVDKEYDPDYIVHLAFPEVPFDIKRQVLRVYRRLLDGQIEAFPKKIFDGRSGRDKAGILLMEVVATNIPSASIPELYERFANSAASVSLMKKAKIYGVYTKMYSTPLEYFHNSLDEADRDEFLYAFWQYRQVSSYARSALAAAMEPAVAPEGETGKRKR